MERYDDSIYGGDELNRFARLSVEHPRIMSTWAGIGILLVVLIIFMVVVHLVSQYFGWGKYGKSDSFVGSYMHWRPNMQDKSEINAVINANAASPPIPIPVGLMTAGNGATYLESNLGSA